jgi:hypothetical protein
MSFDHILKGLTCILFFVSLYGLNALPVSSWFADGNMAYFGNILKFSQLISEPWHGFPDTLRPGDHSGLIIFGSGSCQPWNVVLKTLARWMLWFGEPSFLICVLPGTFTYYLAGWILFGLIFQKMHPVSRLCGFFVYSFLPLGVNISRSIIPENYALLALIIQIWFLQQWNDEKTALRTFALLLSTFFSLYFFPKNALVAAGIFLINTFFVTRKNFFYAGFTPLLFVIIFSIVVKKIYNIHNWTAGHSDQILLWGLLNSASFWKGWWEILNNNYGLFLAGIPLAVFIARRDQTEFPVITGTLIGYLALSVYFTYHAYTHSYYSYPLLVVCSASLSVIINSILRLSFMNKSFQIILCIAIIFATFGKLWPNLQLIQNSKNNTKKTEYLKIQFAKLNEITKNSQKVIFFTSGDGTFFQILSNCNGFPWPSVGNYEGEKKIGKWRGVSEAEYFNLYLESYLAKGAEYFFTDRFQELLQQDGSYEIIKNKFKNIYQDEKISIFKIK